MRHRKPDGFVILPDAFSDGRLSREAWRTVKACLSTVRTDRHPSALRVRAVSSANASWNAIRPSTEIPIRATWVEVWRAIHRVYGAGVLRVARSRDAVYPALGVAVEPVVEPAVEQAASSDRAA